LGLLLTNSATSVNTSIGLISQELLYSNHIFSHTPLLCSVLVENQQSANFYGKWLDNDAEPKHPLMGPTEIYFL